MSDPINPFASSINLSLADSQINTQTSQANQSDNQVTDKSNKSELDESLANRAPFLESKELEAKVREVLKNGMDSQQVEKALLKLKEIFYF